MTQRILGIEESLERIFDYKMGRIHTMLPGFVNSYDPAKQTATIQPVFAEYYELEDGTKEKQSYPAIPNVPVLFPRAGGYYVHPPLKRGNVVMLICCQRSIDDWYQTNGAQEVIPEDLRKHHPSDLFALVMGGTARNKIDNLSGENLMMGHEDGALRVRFTPAEIQIICDAIRIGTEAGALALAKAQDVEDEFNDFKNWANAHTHISNGPGLATNTALPQKGVVRSVGSNKAYVSS